MMKVRFAAIAIFFAAGISSHAQEPRSMVPNSCCSVVEEALRDALRIKPGMKRADLAALFTTEGGLDFHIQTIYVWKRCPYIKIKISFALSDSISPRDSPADVITAVSDPYLQYPVTD